MGLILKKKIPLPEDHRYLLKRLSFPPEFKPIGNRLTDSVRQFNRILAKKESFVL
jgi:hypothetical protein